ncbi:MAG: enoyl-CoA hydratase-related protein, partial [Acidimicrobiales bacterium]
QPVIARVAGMATAAGCQLVASCDLAVAGASARFATPGVDIGLFCSTPMVAVTRNVAPKHAMELLLTGEAISAEEAARIGLVNRVVPDHDLDAAVGELAGKIAAKSPSTIALGKEAYWRQRDLPLVDAYTYTSGVMARNLDTVDAAEGIDAFLTKRPPAWTGR